MTVGQLKDSLSYLLDDIEIVKEDIEGREPVTCISIFVNNRGEVKAIIE